MTDIVERLRDQGKDAFAKHYSLGMFKLCADAADEIERLRNVAQSAPETLWCCHVRGPDDVYPAPDYRTALAWADVLNALNWRVDAHKYPKPSGYENPKSFDDCLVKATPAPWPYSTASHAAGLAAAIEGFSEKSALSSAHRKESSNG